MKRKYKKFLKAAYINYEEDYCGHRSGTFTKPTVTTPIIVITGTTAIIACAISGATIYYTLDGSTPTSNSTEYTGQITLTYSCTIKAIAVKPGMSDSLVASESYVHYLTQWKIVGNSEVHTLPYPDGVVLPNGYKRCKYLEFHGTEYIDSGIIPEQGMSVSIDFEYTKFGSNDYGIIGCREEYSSVDCLYLLCQRANRQICAFYGGIVITQNTPSNPSISTNERILITIDSEQVEIRAPNDTFVKTHTRTITKGVRTMYVGDVNNAGYRKSQYKLYSLKILLSNEYVFNGIPCLDDNDIPCLYDTISGNSFYNDGTGIFGYEIEPQSTEIWSCGEYNATDGKYHILVQPLGGNIADIALTEPLRKVNNVADTIEFPSGTDGKALVTRSFMYDTIDDKTWQVAGSRKVIISNYWSPYQKVITSNDQEANILVEGFTTYDYRSLSTQTHAGAAQSVGNLQYASYGSICLYDDNYIPESGNTPTQTFYDAIVGKHILLELATPTTELVDAPQIAEAESYACVISPGAKAVEWNSFTTE